MLLYKRELVLQVKTAYYNYLSAVEAAAIYNQALELAEAGKKANEKLLANGKGLAAYMLRSESEISQLKAQQNEALNQLKTAGMYFNFLLNKPKDSEIIADTARSGLNSRIQPKKEWNARREELSLLKENINISNNLLNNRFVFCVVRSDST